MEYKKLVDEQRASKSTNYESYFFCPFEIQWFIQNTRLIAIQIARHEMHGQLEKHNSSVCWSGITQVNLTMTESE